MFELTADRTDLALEFKANPYGVHSPELQAALNVLRLIHPNGKMILVCTKPGREWTLAEIRGEPPRAELREEMVFDSLVAAEWAVFKLRWRLHTGSELDVD